MGLSTDLQVGIVIPAYMEGRNISLLVADLLKICPQAKIVVVDDSPNIESIVALNTLKNTNVHAIHRTQKGGRGSAVIEGIKYLVGWGCSWIIEMDADFSHPPTQLPDLLNEAKTKQLDLLIASRYLPESRIENWPVTRRIFSKLSNILARTLLRVPICDYTNGYRVYSQGAAAIVVSTCGQLGKGFIALSEILVNVYYRGLKVGEVPTIFTNRIRGQSSLNAAEISNAFFGLFKIMKLKLRLVAQAKEKQWITGNQ